MQSDEFINVIRISEKYNKLPSEIVGLEYGYVAYCFNEAALFILNYMKICEKEKRDFVYKKRTSYKSFSEMYRKYDRKGG